MTDDPSPDPYVGAPPPHVEMGLASLAPTWRAAYSDRTAALMATLAQLAYVPFVSGPKTDDAAPRAEHAGGRDDLNSYLGPDFDLKQVFNKGDTQAYLAVSADLAVLAFRGTHDKGDWSTNLNARQVPLSAAAKTVMVHCGFLQAFELCQDEILCAIEKHASTTGLYITGHSLGGALAQIASAVLERDNLAACYTFGSPRVGRANFDTQVKCPHYRCVNEWDLVPGVPPPFYLGYRHSGDPRQILKGPEVVRQTRPGLRNFLVDVRAFASWAVLRRLPVIDDHMIWNYRRGLDGWMAQRNPPGVTPAKPSEGGCPPGSPAPAGVQAPTPVVQTTQV